MRVTAQDALRAPLCDATPRTANGPSEGAIASRLGSEARGLAYGPNHLRSGSFSELIALLRTRTQDGAGISALADCPPLRALVAAWPAVRIQEFNTGMVLIPRDTDPLCDWLARAWEQVHFDLRSLQLLIGPGLDPAPLVERASGLLLIYPDGTVHADAARYLRAYAASTVVRSRRGTGKQA